MRTLFTFSAIIFSFVFTQLSASDWITNTGEANNWLFGRHGGITFNTPDRKPKGITGQTINLYATASISDKEGNLLFYSDGFTIFDRNGDTLLFGKIHNIDYSNNSVFLLPFPGNLLSIF
jgi:hypothetical protein